MGKQKISPCKTALNLRNSLALLKLRFAPFKKHRQQIPPAALLTSIYSHFM